MKNVQTKILSILFIIGIVIIFGMGLFFTAILNETNSIIETEITAEQMHNLTNMQMEQTKILILCAILVFSCIVLIVGWITIQRIIKPMDKLIQETEKVANSGNSKLVEVGKRKKRKRKSEVDTLTNVIGIMTGELKQKLNQVDRQRREIEAILQHMNDGILAFDDKGRIMHLNPAAKEMLGLQNERTFDEIFKKLNVEINMEAILYLANWTASEQRVNVGDRIVNIFFAPYKDENDLSSGIIAVVQDITEHVKLDEMRKEFVADVSHELKTPITSIIGYADTLQDGEYDEETTKKFLNVISQEGRRMSNLVSDLLTLSRYDTNKVQKEVTEFDLGELAKKCQEKLRIEIEKKKQNVECYVTADVPPIKADKAGIERVILNVLSNAIKYTEEHGSIKIYVGFVYNDAYIKIIDNGIGIPKEDLGRIFERFYRVDKARTREMGGTGLGLSIAKEIIEQNNGSIDIKSEYGKGTEVVIRIPAMKKTELER